MAVLLEFTVDREAFALGRGLGEAPNRSIRLEQIVPVDSTTIPFFWAEGESSEDLAESVRENPLFENLAVVDRIGERTLYRVEWAEEDESLLDGLVETRGTLLEASGNGNWLFRVRFADHEDVAAFYNYCTEHGIAITVERVYTLTEESLRGRMFEMTEAEREAIVLALRRGYFETPSEVSMSELAEKLEVTPQAVSQRVRRANRKILTGVLLRGET